MKWLIRVILTLAAAACFGTAAVLRLSGGGPRDLAAIDGLIALFCIRFAFGKIMSRINTWRYLRSEDAQARVRARDIPRPGSMG